MPPLRLLFTIDFDMKLILKTLLFVISILVLRIIFDSQLRVNVHSKLYSCQKVHQIKMVDTLIIGDSRVMNGVDPELISKNTLNFGFSSMSYTKTYLDYILRHKSKLKRVIIGISVQSLTSYMEDKSLLIAQEKNCSLFGTYFDELFMQSLQFDRNLLKRFRVPRKNASNNGYHSLGNNVYGQAAIEPYLQNYQQFKFDSKYFLNLLKFKMELDKYHIKSYFVLMPSIAAKYDYDKKISGINLEELKYLFNKNSISLLRYPKEDLEFVDGDHLTRRSSIKFSKWLKSKL